VTAQNRSLIYDNVRFAVFSVGIKEAAEFRDYSLEALSDFYRVMF